MLVLGRKMDEGVILTDRETGRQVRVFVTDVRGDRVKLGFDAPPEIVIERDEIARLPGLPGKHPHGPSSPAQSLPRGETSSASLPPRRYERAPR